MSVFTKPNDDIWEITYNDTKVKERNMEKIILKKELGEDEVGVKMEIEGGLDIEEILNHINNFLTAIGEDVEEYLVTSNESSCESLDEAGKDELIRKLYEKEVSINDIKKRFKELEEEEKEEDTDKETRV